MAKKTRRKVHIFQDGNAARVELKSQRLLQLLMDALTYDRKEIKYEKQGYRMKRTFKSRSVACYETFKRDETRHLVAGAGFIARICETLDGQGYTCVLHQISQPRRPEALEPHWKNIKDFDLRDDQRQALISMAKRDRGQVIWATGVGKSYAVQALVRLFPKARFVITTKFESVLLDRYEELRRVTPSVGLLYSKRKILNKRVMCVGALSLHRLDPTMCDILVGDEIQELATDNMFEKFARFRHSRMFGLSANWNDRMDGTDFELEGFFGPKIASVTYEEGVAKGYIAPIEVRWSRVPWGTDEPSPALGLEDTARERAAIWSNEIRNKQIADDARKFADDQVLITVRTLEHACHLKKLLPEFKLCYAPSPDNEELITQMVRRGLTDSKIPVMTTERRVKLKQMFEKGRLKKVIATSVWNRGVNFRKLQVLIRADAGGSRIDDTQIPGRLSRFDAEGKKQYGILVDYLDEFDDGYKNRSKTRRTAYEEKGWQQVLPADLQKSAANS